jgi:CAAX protease family protein
VYHVAMNSASASQEKQLPRAVQWAAILFALGFPSAFTYVYFIVAAGSHSNLQHLAYTAGKTIQFAFPVLWMLAVERRRVKLPAPTTRGLGVGLALGAAVGAIMLAAYFLWFAPTGGLEAVAPKVREKLSEFQIDTPGKLIAMGLFYSLLHSLLEEYYWRWFAFGRLRKLVSVRAAIAISSIGFMGHHAIVLWDYLPSAGHAWAILASAAVAIGGAMWAWLYERSRSIYAPWLSHLLVDAALFTIAFDMAAGAR